MKSLKRIKNNFIERNSSLLKLAIKSGKGIIFNKDDPAKILASIIGKNPEDFSDQLAMYKGSILKAGQLLSLYGEYYLPKEINTFLDKLKSQTHFLEFDIIQKQIPKSLLEKFEIDEVPIAAASIGQVHKAYLKENVEQEFAVKIQYEGIEKAIGTDIFFIKLLLKSVKFLPKGINFDSVFEEVKKILILETDYCNEARMIDDYRENVEKNFINSQMIKIPDVLKEYSSSKVLVMNFLNGVTLDEYCRGIKDEDFSNHLGETLFKLFLLEIFKFKMVQTDAHGGNYLIDVENKTLGLIDFGACIKYQEEEINFYQGFLYYSATKNKEKFFDSLNSFFRFSNNEIEYDKDLLWDYVALAASPLTMENFDWGGTKIVDELYNLGSKLEKTIKAKNIPHQFIFIDRKVVGLFMMLKKLNANFNVKKIFVEVVG